MNFSSVGVYKITFVLKNLASCLHLNKIVLSVCCFFHLQNESLLVAAYLQILQAKWKCKLILCLSRELFD